MAHEGANRLIVGEEAGAIVACYQFTVITGLSIAAMRRTQIEGVRVARTRRGEGIGAALLADAERRAREASCGLIQFTSSASRRRAHALYESSGFVPSHVGFKKRLD